MKNQLYDTVETDDNIHMGVIDYVSKRQVIIYDITKIESVNLRMAIIEWRMNHYHIRFSIFMKQYFPSIVLPDPIIIGTNGIRFCSKELTPTRPKKIKTRIVVDE